MKSEKMFKCHLYHEGKRIGDVDLPINPEEFKGDDKGEYHIASDDALMPTEAMLYFMRAGCLQVPIPKPDAARKKACDMLDEYREKTLAEAAFDDFKDMILMVQKGCDNETLWNHMVDVFHSRIFKHKRTWAKLQRFITENYKEKVLDDGMDKR
jgi:hypothetical protein